MAHVAGLKSRNGRWTLRVRVPDDVRPTLKKLEIPKSFGAVPFLEACRLGRLERTAIDRLFAEVRSEQRQSPAVDISESELRYLARSYFHRLELGAAAVPLDTEERLVSERSNFEDLMAVSQSEIDVSIQSTAIAFAKWAKVLVTAGTLAFGKLCAGIRQAEIEHYTRQASRLALQYPRFADPQFADVSAATPPLSQLTLSMWIGVQKVPT